MGGSFPPGESRGGLGGGWIWNPPPSADIGTMYNRAVRPFPAPAPAVAVALSTRSPSCLLFARGRQRTALDNRLKMAVRAILRETQPPVYDILFGMED
jgi:hypothetical protein